MDDNRPSPLSTTSRDKTLSLSYVRLGFCFYFDHEFTWGTHADYKTTHVNILIPPLPVSIHKIELFSATKVLFVFSLRSIDISRFKKVRFDIKLIK